MILNDYKRKHYIPRYSGYYLVTWTLTLLILYAPLLVSCQEYRQEWQCCYG